MFECLICFVIVYCWFVMLVIVVVVVLGVFSY